MTIAVAAENLFRDANPYPGEALRNHNERICAFALALARQAGMTVDADLVRAGCMLHDYGLLPPVRQSPVPLVRDEPLYLRRSWLALQPHLPGWNLTADARRQLREILLYNHSLRELPGLSPAGEFVRRAVHVEHSRGVLRFGLSRRFCRETFLRMPRLDLTAILVDFARITLREDGPGQLAPIFRPRFRPRD